MALAFATVCIASANALAVDTNVNPGQSIQAAVNAANPGDRILVHAGTYAGGGWIERSGTATAPIEVISVDGPRRAVIEGGTEALRIGNSNWMIWDGFEVRNSSDNVAHIDSNSTQLTFRNMYFHDAGFNGDVFKVNQCDHITVERSEFARPGARPPGVGNPYQECLDFVHVNDSVIRDNWFHDGGSMLMFVKGGSRNAVIERNTYSVQRAGASDPAVGLGGPTDIALLQGELYEIINVIFRNNVIMDAQVGAVAVYDADGAYVANNLTLDNNRVLVEFRAGNGPAGGSRNVRVVNNLFVDTRGTMPTPFQLSSHTLASFSTENNLYWNAGHSIPTNGYVDVTAQPGFLAENPNIGVPDAMADRATIIATTQPAAGSPATATGTDASGTPFFVTDDIDGITRSVPMSRGPFALSSTAPTTPDAGSGGTPVTPTTPTPDAGSGGTPIAPVTTPGTDAGAAHTDSGTTAHADAGTVRSDGGTGVAADAGTVGNSAASQGGCAVGPSGPNRSAPMNLALAFLALAAVRFGRRRRS